MVSYATNELVSSSDFAKKFGSYLSQIKNDSVEKLAILKNNKVEAVLISKDEYEAMKEVLDKVGYKREKYSIDKEYLKKVIRTTQAIEGYSEASQEVKSRTQDLRKKYGIKVSA